MLHKLIGICVGVLVWKRAKYPFIFLLLTVFHLIIVFCKNTQLWYNVRMCVWFVDIIAYVS